MFPILHKSRRESPRSDRRSNLQSDREDSVGNKIPDKHFNFTSFITAASSRTGQLFSLIYDLTIRLSVFYHHTTEAAEIISKEVFVWQITKALL